MRGVSTPPIYRGSFGGTVGGNFPPKLPLRRVGAVPREPLEQALGPVWQGSGSSKNGFGSGSPGGAASLVELEPFSKTFGKTASLVGLGL